jgi:hypothetical protein
MVEVGGNFGEGCEDESASGERGMRESEAGRVEDEVVHEQEVEVESAWVVGEVAAAIAAVAMLDGEEEFEKSLGGEAGC